MNLKNISDEHLIAKAEIVVREEREKLTSFLHLLKEIDRRRLYSAYQYRSLHQMLVQHFGYSDDEAYRRTSAMKLLKELPEVEEKIHQGEITLTHLGIAQKHFRREKKYASKNVSSETKASVLEQISKTSVREAEKITLSLSSNPEAIKPDRVRVVSEDQIELKFSVKSELLEKIETLKGWLAHKHPSLSMGELFGILCDLGLKELNPANPAARLKACVKKSKAQIRREVFLRANHRCENCGSSHLLEMDHIQPKALGGEDSLENLRLLCRACNQRAAIKAFGTEHMFQFLG